MRTQVGIVGAGPAGLMLARLLDRAGIESVVIENRGREYVEARIRAGILEQGTVELMRACGVADRLDREALRHHGIHLQWPGHKHHLDFPELCGRSVWVYGQTEIVKDLIDARVDAGLPLLFEVADTTLVDVSSDRPRIRFTDAAGRAQSLECDVIAGCDGFHGPSREAIPPSLRTTYGRTYPYSWLGILADVPPSTDDLIYAWHPDGFALHSMRSPTRSRLYLQVDADEDIAAWSDDRIWTALCTRLASDGWELETGPVLDKGILPMRSHVSTPMRYGNLFLAGDAGHIVPPTGAKGLNLAVADVKVLADAFVSWFARHDDTGLNAYSDTVLRRVWRCTHFSWWMTTMLHRLGDAFDAELQLSQLRYVCSSRPAAQSLAENYAGLPL